MRIFLDANILFSAAKSDGAIRQLLRMLAGARHGLSVDSYVVEEARGNLAAKSPEAVTILEKLLNGMHRADRLARGQGGRANSSHGRAVMSIILPFFDTLW